MGLLDWLRGRQETRPKDAQEERLEARREEQGETFPETVEDVEASARERRDEEAGRHSGI